MKAHALAPSLMLLLAAVPCLGQAVSRESQAEVLAACGLLQPEPLSRYGFAKASLVSLWYAKTGAELGNEIKKAGKEADNTFSFVTAMMRISKISTNDFLCAKRSMRPFAAIRNEENIRTVAEFLLVVYDAHISLNQRMVELLKKLETTDQAELMDQLSTLQVERGQRWADLIQPTQVALMMLVDMKRTDVPGKTTRLVITKTQKQALLHWIDEHFPEFKNGTPEDQWSDAAKAAQMYFKVFDGRKCADE